LISIISKEFLFHFCVWICGRKRIKEPQRKNERVYICVCACVFVWFGIYIYVCMCMCLCACVYTCMHLYVSICVFCASMHVRVHVCVCKYMNCVMHWRIIILGQSCYYPDIFFPRDLAQMAYNFLPQFLKCPRVMKLLI
jgi:hypothetical protein